MFNLTWLNSNVTELTKAAKLLFFIKCILTTVDFIYGAVDIVLMNNRGLIRNYSTNILYHWFSFRVIDFINRYYHFIYSKWFSNDNFRYHMFIR